MDVEAAGGKIVVIAPELLEDEGVGDGLTGTGGEQGEEFRRSSASRAGRTVLLPSLRLRTAVEGSKVYRPRTMGEELCAAAALALCRPSRAWMRTISSLMAKGLRM